LEPFRSGWYKLTDEEKSFFNENNAYFLPSGRKLLEDKLLILATPCITIIDVILSKLYEAFMTYPDEYTLTGTSNLINVVRIKAIGEIISPILTQQIAKYKDVKAYPQVRAVIHKSLPLAENISIIAPITTLCSEKISKSETESIDEDFSEHYSPRYLHIAKKGLVDILTDEFFQKEINILVKEVIKEETNRIHTEYISSVTFFPWTYVYFKPFYVLFTLY